MIREGLDITTRIGCGVSCLKYCPQEVLVKRYTELQGTPFTMQLEDFKTCLSTIPKYVIINFSGFCEPFLNPQCIDMIEYANSQGYSLALYTTLTGCTIPMVLRLIDIPFISVVIHLPDADNVAYIPTTKEYKHVLMMILTTMPMVTTGSMNPGFRTNHREDMARGTSTINKWYPVTCNAIEGVQRVLLPNGDVYMCCCDMGLKHRMGNLLTDPYASLQKPSMQKLCRQCGLAMFTPWYHLEQAARKFIARYHA